MNALDARKLTGILELHETAVVTHLKDMYEHSGVLETVNGENPVSSQVKFSPCPLVDDTHLFQQKSYELTSPEEPRTEFEHKLVTLVNPNLSLTSKQRIPEFISCTKLAKTVSIASFHLVCSLNHHI